MPARNRVSAFRDGIGPSSQKKLLEIVHTVPKRCRRILDRAYRGLATQKGAIQAKCLECCGFEDVPERIETCTVYSCPLWAYRPLKKGKS
jgi:hypothetical protein